MTPSRMTLKQALDLANPRSWVAAVYPALLGIAYCLTAGDVVPVWLAVALVLAVIAMQSAVNTLNDYYDFVKGTDSLSDHVEVRDATLLYGGFPPRQAWWLGLGFLGIAAVLAIPVYLYGGIAPLVIGCIGAVVVWSYSGGMLPVSYLPIGEAVSGIVMGGLIPMGVVAAIRGTYDGWVFVTALPLIIGIGLIMMTNNTCDIEKDRLARRRTLPVLMGRREARGLYRLLTGAWLVTMAFLAVSCYGIGGLVVPLIALLVGVKAYRHMVTTKLTPPGRVGNMKAVVMANILGNGIYLLAWFLKAGGVTFG